MTGDLEAKQLGIMGAEKGTRVNDCILWEVLLMDVLQRLRHRVFPPCEDCLYHLGVVRCVVSPCPDCRRTGRRPPFCEPPFGGVRSQREEPEGKGLKIMKETKE